jgi:tRNA (guanine37-N1)-methyltransferase
MRIDILTLFPEMFSGPLDFSIVKRAKENKAVEINIHNLRDWATDKYKSVDDHPYGGGAGMVMRVDIIDAAVSKLRTGRTKVILLDAGGERYTQKKAIQLSKAEHLIFICGHYEGVDHRVHEKIADEVISVGDYVLSGGELPAITIIDSVVRLLPGVLGNEESLAEESHSIEGKTEYPQYTRPEVYKEWKVPEILLSGDHKKIEEWKKSKQ